MITAAAIAIILVASIIQKLTGTGFALVATPVLVLLFGANQGVVLEIFLGTVVSASMLIKRPTTIHWPRTLKLIGAAIVFSPIGFAMVHFLPEPWLMVFVSCAAGFALYSGLRKRRVHVGDSWGAVITAGAGAGILHVTSGLSGPPLIGYALKTKWDQVQFILSIQVIFIGLNFLTLGVRGLPSFSLGALALLLATTLVGIVIAGLTERFFSPLVIKRLMLAIAWTGTIAVFVRGILEILGF